MCYNKYIKKKKKGKYGEVQKAKYGEYEKEF